MLASGPPRPMRAPTGQQWSFEVKWDGIRALALVRDDAPPALRSRNGVDLAGRYPGIVAAASPLGPPMAAAILDGECVAWGPHGRPSFDGVRREGADAAFVVFDVLAWRGRDVRDEPLDRRRARLGTVDLAQLTHGAWQPSPVFDDGSALLAATREQGLEGVMAKRRDSRYRCGVRSPDWVKLPHRVDTEVVVVGWVGSQQGASVASLVVADPAGVLLGTVGSGMTDRLSAALMTVLGGISRAGPTPTLQLGDVAPALSRRVGDRLHWVDPVLVAQVRHLGRTAAGSLRQPTLVGMRPDLSPRDLGGASW